jgi:hypothetical protein
MRGRKKWRTRPSRELMMSGERRRRLMTYVLRRRGDVGPSPRPSRPREEVLVPLKTSVTEARCSTPLCATLILQLPFNRRFMQRSLYDLPDSTPPDMSDFKPFVFIRLSSRPLASTHLLGPLQTITTSNVYTNKIIVDPSPIIN